jgi:hypothetical protein
MVLGLPIVGTERRRISGVRELGAHIIFVPVGFFQMVKLGEKKIHNQCAKLNQIVRGERGFPEKVIGL